MPESRIENEFSRPQGWRFEFGGVNLREAADAISPNKFASAKNIRATATRAVQTRPGYTKVFNANNSSITDIGAYATLGTDDLPRLLVRTDGDLVYDDSGALVTTLAGNIGGGVWFLPFRPGESPQSWMYVASLADYQKISPPGNTTAIGYQVGIAEPNTAVEAQPAYPNFDILAPVVAANFVPSGTAGGLSDAPRVSDTVGATVLDTGLDPTYGRYACQVSPTVQYQIGEVVSVGGGAITIIQDVLPPVAVGTIAAIFYDSGSTGKCVIVPQQAPFGSGPNQTSVLGALRRGCLLQIGGGEIVMVQNATQGPEGTVCFETSTVGTATVGQTLGGIPAIILAYVTDPAGQTLTANQIQSSVGPGLGYISRTNPFNPFIQLLSEETKQEDQYFVFGFSISDPTQINEIRLEFNVDVGESGAPTYSKNYYYYAIQPSLIAGVAANIQTQLSAALNSLTQTTLPQGTALPDQATPGASQWTELYISIDSFTRVGGDVAASLATLNGFRIVVNTQAAVIFSFADTYTAASGQPDVGDDGAGFKYRFVPRNSATGVLGNATPPMRYSIRPRRQLCYVSVPSSAYDGQIDVWDIYRKGGSVTTYRYIGSTGAEQGLYFDDVDNAAANGGTLLEDDNFQPWPSIGVPLKIAAGGPVTITLTGTVCVVSGYTQWPANILTWLPGTLIQIGGQNAFTLRRRPTQLSSTSYRFDLEECAGIGFLATPFFFWVLEPKIANSPNPYVFGPDATGTFFGCGDQYRPGTVSISKAGKPDSVPDKYNLDLCPPSEPLLGGAIKGGVSLVASTERWWALYPSFGDTQKRYTPIEQSVGRGLIAPYAIDTDGVLVYFWAKDGICVTAGGPFESLTNDDLYQLFPHEGVSGVNITRFGLTWYAPDYARAATFRLRKVKTYLFADYQDMEGNPRTIVCDLRTKGWSQDVYADSLKVHFSPRQQSGTLISAPVAQYVGMYMSDNNGNVWKEVDCAGDNSNKIPCHIATFEWDGGDQRMQPLWGDQYLDCVPQSILTVTPTTLGANAAPATIIPASGNRTFAPISTLGGELNKFMGLLVEWTE